MIIEYRIKRFNLVKTFFYNLLHSRRTQIIIFGVAALVILYALFVQYRSHGNLVLSDFLVALLWGVLYILAIPVFSFLTAKTQKRTLSIDKDYIETKIGSQEGRISWKSVESIAVTNDRIFITGKNTNFFSIPLNAFATPELRNNFIALATRYHANLKD